MTKLTEKYQDLLSRQVPAVRSEVEGLGVRVLALGNSLQKTSSDNQKLYDEITMVRLDQDHFHERVENVGRALRQCKQILEGFNS